MARRRNHRGGKKKRRRRGNNCSLQPSPQSADDCSVQPPLQSADDCSVQPPLQRADEALFEAVWNKLGLSEFHRCFHAEGSHLDRRFSSSQRASFVPWVQDRRAAMTVNAIKNTDFSSHRSRCELSSFISKADRVFLPSDHFLPLGSSNGHRFGLRPVHSTEQLYGDLYCWMDADRGDEEYSPEGFGEEFNPVRYEVTFRVKERTYGQLWCPPPRTGLPQSRYGRCSGKGLLGSSPSSYPRSFRQPSLGSDTSSSPSTAGGEFGGSVTESSTSSPRSSVSGWSGSVAANGLAIANSSAPADHAFFPLGRIHVETMCNYYNGPRRLGWVETFHIVAVDTSDQSVWMLYEAWDQDVGQYEFCMGPPRPEYRQLYADRFWPESRSDWARLKGYDDRRRVMAKLADNFQSWQFGSFDVPLAIGDNILPDGVLLVFTLAMSNPQETASSFSS